MSDVKIVCSDSFVDQHCRLSKDVLESVLSYTRGRDIHGVGVIFMQMVNGRDVMRQFSDPKEAVQAGNTYRDTSHTGAYTTLAALSPTLQACALNMLEHSKKVSCLSLLADLASAAPLQSPRRVGSPTVISFVGNGNATSLHPYLSLLHLSPDVRTPNPNGSFGSPEKDYFRDPQRIAPASRWKEDWEELELLVLRSILFLLSHLR